MTTTAGASSYPPTSGSTTPSTSRTREDLERVRELLEVLEGGMWAEEWKGRPGRTDRSVYVALLRTAWHHGTLIPAGVRVSISVLELAEKAGVNVSTICRKGGAEERLTEQRELIRRDGRGQGPKKPGAYVLLVDPRTMQTFTQKQHRRTVASTSSLECLHSARIPLRWRFLGKTPEFIFDALRALGGRAKADDLAVAMQYPSGHQELKRLYLDKLEDRELLVESDGVYAFHPDFGWNLHFDRLISGELDAADRQKAAHKRKREAFEMAWEAGEVISKSERRKREHWARLREELEGTSGEAPAGEIGELQPYTSRQEDPTGEDEAIASLEENPRETIRTVSEVFELAREWFGAATDPLSSQKPEEPRDPGGPRSDAGDDSGVASPKGPVEEWREHPLSCLCDACAFPLPRYARPYTTTGGGG